MTKIPAKNKRKFPQHLIVKSNPIGGTSHADSLGDMPHLNELHVQELYDLDSSDPHCFDLLYKKASYGYLTLSTKGLVIKANLKTASFLGVEQSSLLGKSIKRFILLEDSHVYDLYQTKAFETGNTYSFHLRMVRANGTQFWAHLQVIPFQDGECWLTLSDVQSGIDFTHNHQASMIEGLTASIPGVVYEYIVRPDGSWHFPFVSKGIEALFGVTQEDACHVADVMTRSIIAEDRHGHRESVRLSTEKLLPWFSQHRIKTPAGALKWIRGSALPTKLPDGSILWHGILTDITDIMDLRHAYDIQTAKLAKELEARKKVEKELQKMIEKKTYQLTEAQRIAHIGSWELDLLKDELNWSDEIYRIFGLEPFGSPATYETFLSCIHPEDRDLVKSAYSESIAYDIPYDIVHRIVRKTDGQVRHVHEQCSHLRDKKGSVVRSIGTVQDVTELVAKENGLKEYAHHIVKMLESERTRIARELHDDLGQALTVLSFAINQLKHDHTSRKKVLQILPDMQGGVDRMMQSVRRICTALRPALLDELGLPAALEWLCKDFSRRTGLPCSTAIKGKCCSYNNMECCMIIFRIVQESLNNTMKHAGASKASISLTGKDGNVYVEISDDGCGIGKRKRSGERSFGIIGMRERASALGAQFEIISKKGQGTSVKLVIPCPGQEATDAVSHC